MDTTISHIQYEYERRLLEPGNSLILFMVNDSPGLKYGVGTYRDSIIRVFSDERHVDVIEVVLKAYVPYCEPQFEVADGIPRYLFPSCNAADEDYYRSVCFFLTSRIARSRSLVVHCNYACQLPLARCLREHAGARIVYTQHYMDWCIRFGPDYTEASLRMAQDAGARRKFGMEKDMMALADTVIVSTDVARRTLESVYGVDGSRIRVIPLCLGMKPETSLPSTLRNRHRLSDERILLYVGRLDENKGVGDLIRAVAGLDDDDIRLWIVGDGDYGAYLSLIDERNWHRITFWGFRDRKTIAEMYGIAEIGLVPSFYEEFGYVALEMMAHGLPVIARNTSGLTEILENGKRGDMFDFRSTPDEIRVHIARRLRNPYPEGHRRALMEHAARRYGFSLFRDAIFEVFQSLMDGSAESDQSACRPVDPLLRSIADREIMRIPFVRDPSLSEGMTGMAVFFSMLGTASGIRAYEDVAQLLLDKVCGGIPEDIGMDFHHGITGIGWVLVFLKERGVIESDIGSILEELDWFVLDRLQKHPTACMDDDALTGIRRYVRARLDLPSVAGRTPEDPVLTRLGRALEEIGVSPLDGATESADSWKECLRYWRHAVFTDDPTWKTGLLMMERKPDITDNRKI